MKQSNQQFVQRINDAPTMHKITLNNPELRTKLEIPEDFDVFSEDTLYNLEYGNYGVLECLAIAIRKLPNRRLKDVKHTKFGLVNGTFEVIESGNSEECEKLTRFALLLFEFHSTLVCEIAEWLGFRPNHIAYLSAWTGNKLVFDLVRHTPGLDFTYDPNTDGDLTDPLSPRGVKGLTGFCRSSIALVALHGGNMDMIKSIGPRSIYEGPSYECTGGNGFTEYDFAAQSNNPEVVWWLFIGDLENGWKRDNDVFEMHETDLHDYQNPYCYKPGINPNPMVHKTFLFMRYLDPCNTEPIRGKDEDDEWHYEKLKWLIDNRPDWYSIQTVLLFKKPHFYHLIDSIIDSVGEVPKDLFKIQRKVFPSDIQPDYGYLRDLLIEKRSDLKFTKLLIDNPKNPVHRFDREAVIVKYNIYS